MTPDDRSAAEHRSPTERHSRDPRPFCERRADEAREVRDDAETERIAAVRAETERLAAELEAKVGPFRGISRREFVEWLGLAAAGMAASPLAHAVPQADAALRMEPGGIPTLLPVVDLRFTLNGNAQAVQVEPRTSLLDLLREHMGLAGTRKGCNQGACGACTVHVDAGRGPERVNSCLTLAVQAEGCTVRTIEGLAGDAGLHPVQRAFIEHDGFQCGYCTPGQIMSAVALMAEAEAGQPSWVTPDVAAAPQGFAALSDDELRERMSGNLCRCGAYVGMLAALHAVQSA